MLLTPQGRDAAVAAALLSDAGMASFACGDAQQLSDRLDDDVWFAVVAEEALRSTNLGPLRDWIARQPSWSDLPFVVLTHRGGGPDRNPAAALLSDVLGNVTFLERPFHPTTFVSVARTAHRGRLRQFEARARIEELREGEQRLHTALLAGKLGSWELDLATSAFTASPTCRALLGVSPDRNLDYSDLLALVPQEDKGLLAEALGRTVAGGEDYTVEFRIAGPDADLRWMEARAHLVPDREGSTRRLVGVLSDITARRAAEDRMRGHNEELEIAVAERTAALSAAHAAVLAEIDQRKRAEEQLRQAQKLEMIGQLTGGVAHDFNNLLMAVLGNLELLAKHTSDPRSLRLIDGAVQGAKRGAALTQRLLAFARRQELDIRPANLGELVRGMMNLLERSVGAQIEVRLRIPDALPSVLIDTNQVELALLNLAVNSRDAMPNGGVLSIELDALATMENADLASGSYVRMRVSDNGHGMDAATLAKATEPFFSTKELGKGTGLGLSMIHGLAVQLDGTLRLSSKPGAGTTAEIWLPTTEEVAAVEAAETAPPIDETAKLKVLVVDDDVLIAMSTVGMLEDLGHEVVEAGSGGRALQLLSQDDFDLMITDFSMPQMNGAQLAQAARQIKPSLPILLASGYAELPPGVNLELPRISKPYRQSQLADEIARILKPNHD